MDSKSPNCLRFDHTAEEIKNLTDSSIKDFTAVIDGLSKLEGPRTFENTIIPVAKLDYDNYCIEINLTFYKDNGAEKDLREASLASSEKFDEFGINQWMRQDFYLAIKDFKKQAEENGEWAKLGAEDQRYVDRLIRDFERNGLSLPDAERDAIKQLQKEIADIERTASNNINEDKTKVEFPEAELEGLPAGILEKLEKVPEKEGCRYVSMKYPEILPSLKLCKKEETRRILNKAYGSRCQEANVPLLEDLVKKRHELAIALGFSSYSEYILSIRMAKTPLNV